MMLPWEAAQRVLGGIGLPVLLVYPIATIALGWLLANRLQRENAADALAASETRYPSVFEAANVGKSVTLPTGEIDVNRAFCDMLGYSPEELRGKTWQELTPPEEIGPINELLAPLLRGEKNTVRFEKQYIHKNGSYVWADFSAILQRDRDDNPLHFIVTVVDITDRKQAEEKLAKSEGVLRDIMESTLSGFWDWNLVDNTEYLSPTFKRMFGYEEHEMENLPEAWQKIIFPEDLPGVLEVFDRHVKSHGREPFYNEISYRHRDSSTVWVICPGRVIEWAEDGTAIRMVGCHIDITERKQAEEFSRKSAERAKMQRNLIAQLIFDDSILHCSIEDALKTVTRKLTATMQVDRISVWLLSEHETKLQRLMPETLRQACLCFGCRDCPWITI